MVLFPVKLKLRLGLGFSFFEAVDRGPITCNFLTVFTIHYIIHKGHNKNNSKQTLLYCSTIYKAINTKIVFKNPSFSVSADREIFVLLYDSILITNKIVVYNPFFSLN